MKKIIFLIVLSFVFVAKIAFASPLGDYQKGIYFFNKLKQTPFPHQNQYMPVRYELFKKAIYYFKKSAHSGYIPADYYLSRIYYLGDSNEIVYWRNGNGGSCATDQGASGRKTEYYLKKAAHANYIPAELKLALYYVEGIISYKGIKNSNCLTAKLKLIMQLSRKKAIFWDAKVLQQGGKKYCGRVVIVNSQGFKSLIVKYCGISYWRKNYE
jgi:hypothetical protein